MKINYFLLDFLFWSSAAQFRLGHLDYVCRVLGRRAIPARRLSAWRALKIAMRGLFGAARRWHAYLAARP